MFLTEDTEQELAEQVFGVVQIHEHDFNFEKRRNVAEVWVGWDDAVDNPSFRYTSRIQIRDRTFSKPDYRLDNHDVVGPAAVFFLHNLVNSQ